MPERVGEGASSEPRVFTIYRDHMHGTNHGPWHIATNDWQPEPSDTREVVRVVEQQPGTEGWCTTCKRWGEAGRLICGECRLPLHFVLPESPEHQPDDGAREELIKWALNHDVPEWKPDPRTLAAVVEELRGLTQEELEALVPEGAWLGDTGRALAEHIESHPRFKGTND